MDTVDRKTFFGFSLLEHLYWAFYAAYVGFISTYLLSCGMSSAALSIMLAVFMGFSFIGSFFWGGKCDKARTNKKIFIPEFIGAVVIAIVIFFMAKKSVAISAVLYPLFGFLSAPLGSNLDSWMLRSFNRSAADYGRARAIGSAGFAITALIMGQLISRIGYQMIPIGTLVLAALVLVIALIMPEKPYGDQKGTLEPVNPAGLLKIGPYMYLVLILFTVGLAVSPINNLKIVILQSVGGDVSILGLDSFLGVMVQAALLFVSGSLRKIPPYVRLFMMSLCVLAEMALIVFAVSPWMIILGTVFANMSYGIMLPTQREIVEATVSGNMKNTAHSMSDAMFGSFAGIIALLYSGTMMDKLGAKSVAVLGCGILVIPVLMSLIGIFRNRKTDRG